MSDDELTLESQMKLHDVRNHLHLYAGRREVKRILRERLETLFEDCLALLDDGRPPEECLSAVEEGRKVFDEFVQHDRSMDRAFERIVGILFSSHDPEKVEVVSLAKLVGEEVAYFHSDLRRLPVDRLTFSASFDPWVRADPQRLRRVVDNLILNAADALCDDGGIEVSVDLHGVLRPREGVGGPIEPGSYGTLTVRDEGAGIETETVERAFEPGYSSKDGHAGLGLTFVRQVAKETDAGVEVLPSEPRGTTFRIYFPLAEPE